MRAVGWLVSVAMFASSMPVSAQTLYCSTWNGIRTCSSPLGFEI